MRRRAALRQLRRTRHEVDAHAPLPRAARRRRDLPARGRHVTAEPPTPRRPRRALPRPARRRDPQRPLEPPPTAEAQRLERLAEAVVAALAQAGEEQVLAAERRRVQNPRRASPEPVAPQLQSTYAERAVTAAAVVVDED